MNYFFLFIFFLTVLLSSDASHELKSVLINGNKIKFSIYSRELQGSSWLILGQTFDGMQITFYDREKKILTLVKPSGDELLLKLNSPDNISLDMMDFHESIEFKNVVEEAANEKLKNPEKKITDLSLPSNVRSELLIGEAKRNEYKNSKRKSSESLLFRNNQEEKYILDKLNNISDPNDIPQSWLNASRLSWSVKLKINEIIRNKIRNINQSQSHLTNNSDEF